MGSARSSEDMLEAASGLMGSPLPLWPWLALASEVFASSRVRKRFTLPDDPLVTFRSPPEFTRLWSHRAGMTLARLPPLRFLPLRRLDDDGQPLIPGLTRSLGSVTFSAFLTLSRSSSARHLPALFHAGPAHGVSLQGRFPPAEQYVLSNAGTLLWLVREPPLQGLAPCERPSSRQPRLAETATLRD
jgi:hypothetical protein